ncbi:probable lysosomal cobalamin transporter [Aplysia californica]|uniref:Probable lysosomal cobalamin transporter n=1 Tax=Aplysia californica TaxID=6500 RepID=A0ABM0K745_APLCA|nr:probable lysosomal cobalamin transporter [Aplysia californica]
MAIPGAVVAAGWIPFMVVIVLTLLFSGFYVRYYMSKYDSEVSTTITAIIALTITLLTSALVPVDIFLVSYMKDSDGMFKDWANSSSVRDETEDTVLIAYYVLYGLVAFCLFLLLPFMYFFFEEKEENSTCKSRCCSALKYCIVCVLIAATLFLIGAFVPSKSSPNSNSTEWRKIQALFEDMTSNGIEDSLSFVMSVFSLVGMLGILFYTAYGMSAMPMDLIKGKRSVKKERMQTQAQREERQRKREERRERYRNPSKFSRRTRERDQTTAEEDSLLSRRERHLVAAEKSWLRKCRIVFRPFEIILGIIFFLVAMLVFISLLLTNIDKAMHSLGYKSGYALPERHLPNPVDIVLVFCQKAFPLDYILMVGIIAYFVLCSMSGIKNIGVWFFWIQMYKIRPRRTSPQGLLMFCMILMFIVMAINVLLYELTPQYSSFGSEHYANVTFVGNGTIHTTVKQCTTEVSEDFCVVTRMTLLLVRFFYKMWVFGAAYYWLTWVFLGTVLISFLVAVIKKRRSVISGEVDDDDFEESDDEMIRA